MVIFIFARVADESVTGAAASVRGVVASSRTAAKSELATAKDDMEVRIAAAEPGDRLVRV
jgi:hypothetical protein